MRPHWLKLGMGISVLQPDVKDHFIRKRAVCIYYSGSKILFAFISLGRAISVQTDAISAECQAFITAV